MRTIISLLMVLVVSSNTYACGRCGLFGRRCRFVRPVVKQHVVKQPAVQQQQTIALQVNYPPALVKPGNTSFGYSAYSSAQFNPLDPNLVANLYSRIATQAVQGLDSTRSEGLQMNAKLSSSLEQVAKVQAATEHLKTAVGQTTTSESSSGYTAELRVNNGKVTVHKEKTGKRSGRSVITKRCAECHGSNLSSPKGGVFIDPSADISPSLAWRALDLVRQDKMPKDQPLSDQDKAAFMEELFNLAGEE